MKVETAAKVFQKMVVLEDCIATTGTKDMCRCFTCGRLVPRGKNLHAGHWKKRSNHSVIFERSNCNAQCYVCNRQQGGNMVVYEQKMIEKYGQAEHDRIVILKRIPKKWTTFELEAKVLVWRARIKMLETHK